jgi:hypothetical protein
VQASLIEFLAVSPCCPGASQRLAFACFVTLPGARIIAFLYTNLGCVYTGHSVCIFLPCLEPDHCSRFIAFLSTSHGCVSSRLCPGRGLGVIQCVSSDHCLPRGIVPPGHCLPRGPLLWVPCSGFSVFVCLYRGSQWLFTMAQGLVMQPMPLSQPSGPIVTYNIPCLVEVFCHTSSLSSDNGCRRHVLAHTSACHTICTCFCALPQAL